MRVINFEVVFYQNLITMRNAFDILKIVLVILFICVLGFVVAARRLNLVVLKEDLRLRQIQLLLTREAFGVLFWFSYTLTGLVVIVKNVDGFKLHEITVVPT
jgi:hypothetical protein